MMSMGSVSRAYIFFWVPAVLFVCLNVLFGGGYLAAGITRLLRDVLKQKALWGPWEKAGIVTTDVCVRLPVCVCVCAGGCGLRKCGSRKRKGEGVFESQTVIVVVCCAGQWRPLAGPGALDCNPVVLRRAFHVSWLKACESWELTFGQGRMMWHSHGFSCHWLKKGCFQMAGHEISSEDDDKDHQPHLLKMFIVQTESTLLKKKH